LSMVPVVINSLLVFYLTYALEIPDLLPVVILAVMAVAVLSFPLWSYLSRRWDRLKVMALGILIYAFALILLVFVQEGNITWLWLIVIPAGLGNMALVIFSKALVADLVAYDQACQGRSRAGFINGLLGPSYRVGSALGSVLVGWLLTIIGYSGGAPITIQLKEGLKLITGLIPSILLLTAIPLALLYPLRKSEMARVEKVLEESA